MKTRTDAHGTAENESGSAKHENVTRHLRYRRKRIRARKKRKRDPTPSVPPKKNPRAQYMKTGPEAHGIAENESGRTKHENWTRCPRYHRKRIRACKTLKWDPTPLVPPKMSSGAQNTKTGPDALGNAENESGSAKHENVTRHLRFRRKRIRARKKRKRDPTPSVPPKKNPGTQYMKTRLEALVIAENKSGRTKQENWTRGPRYRRKRVWARKT
jgi:hypothetical protein